MDNPLHFGGLHSTINTNLMQDIDVYSSAFPAEFGSATAAVINITTIDDVNEFGGYTDLSLLSADALIKAPILKNKNGNLAIDSPSHTASEDYDENVGYIIASGRYGYITLAIKAAELITGQQVPISPEYWDYQFKIKYKIDNVNSLTMLLFGHKDYFRVLVKSNSLESGADPLFTDAQFQTETMSHNQGLYLDSRFTQNFSNKLLYYSSLPDSHTYLNLPSQSAPSALKDVSVHSDPWVFGIKDKVKIKWLDGHCELLGGPEYSLYYFDAYGKSFKFPAAPTDITDATSYPINETTINHKVGAYMENKITYGGYTFLPGIRSEYLARTDQITFDPRGMMSYKFPTETTISAAGGHYSNFFQTNPNYFSQISDVDLASVDSRKTKPEKAWHASLGAEQEYGLLTFKLEGFSNYFYDMWEDDIHTETDGSSLPGFSSGKLKARGIEIMIRKDSRENQDGLFGWISYTYEESKFKSGLPTAVDTYGDTWISSSFEQRHSVKLVSGYKFGEHIVTTRFQYYSGFPYTPINGYYEDSNYAIANPGQHRYVPTYGETNSKYFPAYWQLDLRYTRKIAHSWGSISWYVEGLNVFMKSNKEYKWYYDRQYSAGSNPVIRNQNGFNFLPNFGVEVKF